MIARGVRSLFRLVRRVAKVVLGTVLSVAILIGALLLATFLHYRSVSAPLLSDLSSRTVNDVTELNPTQVGRVIAPRRVEDIVAALKSSSGSVSIGGARNSQGGQTSHEGSLHLDMRQMNRVLNIDKDAKTATVQAGIRWRDLQDVIDPLDLSVLIMQTYANFSVGGTLSVNAHGRYMGQGPAVLSVLNLKLVLPSGDVVEASRESNPELFWGVVGGYGGLAVIAEATLQLTENHKVERSTETMETARYLEYFTTTVREDEAVVFHNADLHPPDFKTLRAVSWSRTTQPLTNATKLIARDKEYYFGTLLDLSTTVPFGFWARKHVLEPWIYRRNEVTWRNHEASYDLHELDAGSRKKSTYVLQEYFVPIERFDEFVGQMRNIFLEHDVAVANVSIRHAIKDPGTLLAWARDEVFAFVVYYKQGTGSEDRKRVGMWTRELIDAVVNVEGTYYLPYQVHATEEQFHRAYPRAKEFFALKQRVDPNYRFRNSLWEAYYPQRSPLSAYLERREGYKKPESQTLLTIPEWYLVFNPKEYADYLESGQNPDGFPFFESVDEYWKLYKKSIKLTAGIYPRNPEYITMLRVIGISTAIEYFIKGAYENTIGGLFRRLGSDRPSPDELLIREAHRAYSDFIYDDVWYAFDFMSWVRRSWSSELVGFNVVRPLERRLAFCAEFLVKAAYARLIEFAARSTYQAPRKRVVMVVHATRKDALDVDPRLQREREFAGNEFVVSVPRWEPFTEITKKLAENDVDFREVAGNDDIAVTLLHSGVVHVDEAWGQTLAVSHVVTQPSMTRSIVFLRVEHLAEALRDFAERGIAVEHIFDY